MTKHPCPTGEGGGQSQVNLRNNIRRRDCYITLFPKLYTYQYCMQRYYSCNISIHTMNTAHILTALSSSMGDIHCHIRGCVAYAH